ncbi:MAG TPA: DsbA family protein [Egibacteraceae bacterium]|nr:DsbA family protein [Egibacteraceae bacterium]
MGLTLFHDYTSPASAVAVARLQRLADDGLDVTFEGFEAIGVDAVLPPSLDVLAAIDDLAEAAQAEGVVLRRPPALPPTAAAHAVGVLAESRGLGASWRQTCYRAFWADGADISETLVLIALAQEAGLQRTVVQEALNDRAFVATTRRAMGRHRRNGVGGVPTILTQRTLIPGLLPEAELRALAAY